MPGSFDDYAPYEDPIFDEPGESTPSPLDIEVEFDGSRDPLAGGAAIPGQFNVRPLPVGGQLGPSRSGGFAGGLPANSNRIPSNLPGGRDIITIDVDAVPVYDEPELDENPGIPLRIPLNLPEPDRPRTFNAPRPFEAQPLPIGVGGNVQLPEEPPQLQPSGLTDGQESFFGDEAFQPQGQQGQDVIVYAGWTINVFRFTTGELLNTIESPYQQRGNDFPAPVSPLIEMNIPGSPAGTRLTLGVNFDLEGTPDSSNFLDGGGFNTDFQLQDFTFGTNPVAGEPAFPRPERQPPDRFRPFPLPLGFPLPTGEPPLGDDEPPEVNNQGLTDSPPVSSPANFPVPVPSPFPSSSPNGEPPRDTTPPGGIEPTPGMPPVNPNQPAPPPPFEPDLNCQQLRDCLAPTFRDILIEELRSQLISQLVDAILNGDCSLPAVCDKVDEVIELLTASERLQLDRQLCSGTQITVIRSGRRIEEIVPSIQTLGNFLRDLIEYKLPCKRYETPILLDSGVSQLGQEVRYVPTSNVAQQVELVLVGQLPDTIRLYRMSGVGQEQAKFGNLSAAYQFSTPSFSTIGDQSFVWTRGTILDLPQYYGVTRYVRVFLEPGLQWELRDTGLRDRPV